MLEVNEQAGQKTDNSTATGDAGAEPAQSHMPGAKDGQCRLLGPFAILVQAALGLLALLSLVWKRWRETPPRPLKIWFFDVSKQVFGSVLLHIANLFMSMISSGKLDVAANRAPKTVANAMLAIRSDARSQPNPCSFYLLNLAIDVSLTGNQGRPKPLSLLLMALANFSTTLRQLLAFLSSSSFSTLYIACLASPL